MSQAVDVAIIGAGISGLTAAYQLTQAGKSACVSLIKKPEVEKSVWDVSSSTNIVDARIAFSRNTIGFCIYCAAMGYLTPEGFSITGYVQHLTQKHVLTADNQIDLTQFKQNAKPTRGSDYLPWHPNYVSS